MNSTVDLVVCMVAAAIFSTLSRAYFFLPLREMRRRAAHGVTIYKKLQLVTKYGGLARAILITAELFFAILAVIISVHRFSTPGSFVVILLLIALLKLTRSKPFPLSSHLAALIAPSFAAVLKRIQPLTDFFADRFPFRRKGFQKTNLYEKEDLLELLKQQKTAPNNRIDQSDLDNALHTLEMRIETVRVHMVPRVDIHFVTPKDSIGPILLSELHKSGHACFPVLGNGENDVVGMLHMQDLADYTEGGTVANAMSSHVFYVRSDEKLEKVLQAYTATGASLFMVVNKHREVVGLITVSDVLEQLVGQAIYADFNSYDDPEAVAAGQEDKTDD